MLVGLVALILFVLEFGKAGAALLKGILMLAVGSLLLLGSCSIL